MEHRSQNIANKSQNTDKIFNYVFGILIVPVLLGLYIMIIQIDEYTKPMKEINKSYKFPNVKDFNVLVYICPIIAVIIIYN